jgi:hypothetical protein
MTSGLSCHLVAQTITFGSVRRQRCLWCGALVDEVDLARIASTSPGPIPHWEGWVMVDGNARYAVAADDGRAPDEACMRIDHEVTR